LNEIECGRNGREWVVFLSVNLPWDWRTHFKVATQHFIFNAKFSNLMLSCSLCSTRLTLR
jgi:hypothetical protein